MCVNKAIRVKDSRAIRVRRTQESRCTQRTTSKHSHAKKDIDEVPV